MGTNFSFIHTADIHLGSYLNSSIRNEMVSEVFKNATADAFTKICNTAIARNVDFILISGDLYDSEGKSVKIEKFFIDECRRLGNIQVYIIHGNHDPSLNLKKLFEIPKNVHFFSCNDMEKNNFVKNGEIAAVIYGESYKGKNESTKIFSPINAENDMFNIVLLHTQLEGIKSNYIPCTLNELIAIDNINYWALGHIHVASILNKDPYCVFPGIPQGRDMGERGEKGCFLVTVNELNEIDTEFISIAGVILERINLKILEYKGSSPENINDLEDLILDKAKLILNNLNEDHEEFKGICISWILEDRCKIHELLLDKSDDILKQIKEDLNSELCNCIPFIYTEEIVDNTSSLQVDFENLKTENSIYLAIETKGNECLENEKCNRELMNTMGKVWSNKGDREELDDHCFYMDKEKMKEIIDKAQNIIFEKLIKSGE